MEIKANNFLISMDGNSNFLSIQTELSQHAIDILYQLISVGINMPDHEIFSFEGCEIELGLDLLHEFSSQIEYKLVDMLFHLFFYEFKGCSYMYELDDESFIRLRRG
ncbi:MULTISPECIES: hypothetical protein [Staphylococcaceae]|uniref:hypothetical protein n=1 Tax=Staphylococcaceae TaxID=90964 RepID=UPI0019518776|nr:MULTISPECIES: hypothetical protein [Staphylococcaceae]